MIGEWWVVFPRCGKPTSAFRLSTFALLLGGAAATTHAIFLARNGAGPEEIRAEIQARYAYNMSRTVDEIRRNYRFNETCQETVPEALVCALEAKDFEDAIRNAISIGGDSDTVAAIAGGLAEAMFGIPDELAREGLAKLPTDMKAVLETLYAKRGNAKNNNLFK